MAENLDVLRERLITSFADLAASQRVLTAREIADQLRAVLDAAKRGEITSTPTEAARIEGAVIALDAVGAESRTR